MDDDYKEEDQELEQLSGFRWFFDAVYRNVVKQAARGFLFGFGHYLTYKVLGGYLIQKFPSLDS